MITVTLLTKNSEKHIERVLSALASFDEVLIGDTGSVDQTLEIASRFPNVRIEKLPFEGFGKTHNELAVKSKHEWIFSVDSDEIATPELIKEIQELSLDPTQVYSVPRKNFYRQQWIWSCGWYPDRVNRLYNRTRTHFSSRQVHEAVETKGLFQVALQNPLFHYPYEKVSDFLTKMQFYTDLYAKEHKGRRSGYWTALGHASFTFFKSYIIKRGIMQGGIGFEISAYNAITAFYKYLKLI